jgi:aryl-alcohol dehydrogenase-like predicted oxidoreductase
MVATPLPGCDLPVAPLVLGGNMLGGRLDERESFALLDAWVEAGGTMVDTAAVYADWLPDVEPGCSERTIGRWLAARPSSPLSVATKGGHPAFDRPDRRRLDAASLRHDVEQSLDRLGLPSLPLWFTHRDDPDRPVEDIVGAVEALRSEGLLRWYGVSNWSARRITEVVALRDAGLTPGFIATQSAFALVTPRADAVAPNLVVADEPMLALHRQARLTLFGYSAQAKGWFSEAPQAESYDTAANRRVREVVGDVAGALDAEPGQVALAATLRQDTPVRLVVGCSSRGRLRDAVAATALELTAEHMTRIRSAGSAPSPEVDVA